MRPAFFPGFRLGLLALFSLPSIGLPACGGSDLDDLPVDSGDGDDSSLRYECFDSTGCADGSECRDGFCAPVDGTAAGTGGASTGSGGGLGSGGGSPAGGSAGVGGMGSGGDGPGTGGVGTGGRGSGGDASGGAGTGGIDAGAGGADMGTGGADLGTGGGPMGAGGAAMGTGGASPSDPDLIDDLEDGDVNILPTGGRVGFWYTYNETVGAADLLASARPLADAPESVSASFAMHATGSHINAGASSNDAAYGGVGLDLNNANADGYQPRSTSRKVYDASQYDGVEFRVRSTGTDASVRFEVVTAEIVDGPGGTCSGGQCWDSYGMDVPLTSIWTTITVPFASLTQEGWGAAVEFDASHLLGFTWNDTNSTDWDFWIDDVKFYTGAVVDPPPNSCDDSWGEESNGSVTWYSFDQGTNGAGDVNCSFGITTGTAGVGDTVDNVSTGAGTYFAAINTADYDAAAACGACVEVTRDGGPSVVATVVDQCPVATNDKCVKGHIDLSKAAFLQLGTEGEGYLGQRAGLGDITWRYVACPTTGNVKFRLKEPANQYWNQVIVEHHSYPIESVQVSVNGTWVEAVRESYNYWTPPGGTFGAAPYWIRAIDIYGNEVEGSIALSSGSQDSGSQLVCE